MKTYVYLSAGISLIALGFGKESHYYGQSSMLWDAVFMVSILNSCISTLAFELYLSFKMGNAFVINLF
jgi:hypothetical protein